MLKYIKAIVLILGLCVLNASISMGTIQAKEQTTIQHPQLAASWPAEIQQWAPEIIANAQKFGLDPDLVAAIVQSESNGFADGVSYAGAVGLMGIMPQGPGFEYRPNAELLLDPMINISWGCAILADIIQQSGGDLRAALAAYNGGWYYASYPIPKAYSDKVLSDYAVAVVTRTGINIDIAESWTIGVDVQRGNIAAQQLLVGSELDSAEIKKFGEHVIYSNVDKSGRSHYVTGYAVPLIPQNTSSTYLKIDDE